MERRGGQSSRIVVDKTPVGLPIIWGSTRALVWLSAIRKAETTHLQMARLEGTVDGTIT